MDSLENAAPSSEPGVSRRGDAPSVSQLTRRLRGHVENAFFDVWVRGEVSGYRKPSSGHAYFVLKDAGASLKACLFRNVLSKTRFAIEDGMEVLLHGRLTVYEPRGEYQIVADLAEPVGTGALQLAFEQLKAKLASEGLFDPSHKKPLPTMPRRIAVITSPTGAAVHDIIHVLSRRFPNLEVLIFPASVQGEKAAGEIIGALQRVLQWNAQSPERKVELLILGRGGGSLEDLWPFNEESVARALFAFPIPVISAVGHETDFTITDFIADLRAPTPSAAAEIAVPKREDLFFQIQTLENRLARAMRQRLDGYRLHLSHLCRRIVSPAQKVEATRKQVLKLLEQCLQLFSHCRERKRSKLSALGEKLHTLSPLQVLGRGYSITSLSNGEIVRSALGVPCGAEIRTRFSDGIVISEVLSQSPPPGVN
jgi:exodeoxyribonuclease VII large subunit